MGNSTAQPPSSFALISRRYYGPKSPSHQPGNSIWPQSVENSGKIAKYQSIRPQSPRPTNRAVPAFSPTPTRHRHCQSSGTHLLHQAESFIQTEPTCLFRVEMAPSMSVTIHNIHDPSFHPHSTILPYGAPRTHFYLHRLNLLNFHSYPMFLPVCYAIVLQ